MSTKLLFSACLVICLSANSKAQVLSARQPVNFSKVEVNDHFWRPRIDLVATKTLEACIYQTEVKTPRIRNFEKVARAAGEKHEGS